MSKFPKKVEKTAKTVDEAIKAALNELGVSQEDAQIEIIDEGSKGFLGIGARYARVAATLKYEPADEIEEAEEADDEYEAYASDEDEEESSEQTSTPAAVEVSEERKARAVKFLTEVFEAMQLDVTIDVSVKGDMLELDLSGDSMGIIIGKRGDTLDSLQYLTSLVVNHGCDDYVKVTIDTENYREKRTQALLQLSNRLADKVAKSGRRYTLEPMNPYERRVIHSNLQDNPDVTTYSVGDEPYRKVVIAPKNPKPYSRKPHRRPTHGSHSSSYHKGGSRPQSRGKIGGYNRGYAHDKND